MSSFISEILFFFSCLFSSLLFHLLVSSLLLSRLLFSCLVLSFLVLSCLSFTVSQLSLSVSVFFQMYDSLFLSVSVTMSLCLRVVLCVVVLCGVCVVWCVARLGTQKKPPCKDAKRPRVYRHHAHMCYHMCAWCRYTRGRCASTHGRYFGPTHGGQGVIVSAAYQNLATCGDHVLQMFTTRYQSILPIFSLRTGRESNTLPIPPNIRCA